MTPAFRSLRHGARLLALAVVLAGCKKPAPPPVAVPTPTPTPLPSTDIVAFTRAGTLWICKVNGDDQRPLAAPAHGQALWFPSPAADGSHFIAWLSRPDGTEDVARVELNGRVTVLTDIGEQAGPPMKNLRLGNAPVYSPDGKRIAYSFNGNLWIMDANGYNAETLIADGASWAPAFSPDGKKLAYCNGKKGRYDLWVADLDSRDTYQVSDFAEYTVGRPQWNPKGDRLMVTRSQGDESDIVMMLAATDTPLADADVLTKDHNSAGAVFSPSGSFILLSSARGDGETWSLVSMDITGNGAKELTKSGGLSPAWMRPSTLTAMVFDSGPSRPTPVAAMAAPTAMPTAAPVAVAVNQARPAVPTALPSPAAPAPASKPVAPLAQATVPASKPAAPPAAQTAQAVRPAPSAPSAPAPGPANAPSRSEAAAPAAAPAPTQPPLKAAPLRLRFKASFDAKDSLSLAALTDLKKLAPRVKQYAGAQVTVVGPQDASPLKGRYASAEDRSQARAEAVAGSLAKFSGADSGKILSQPYSPPSAGGGVANSILIYVEMK